MTDLSLFPEINPNIEEIIQREQSASPDDVEIEANQETKRTHKDYFEEKPSLRDNEEMNSTSLVDLAEEDNELVGKVMEKKPSKKGRYDHLNSARLKGLEKRREKAKEKKLAKIEAKKIKEIEKAKRREATKERNRDKARERYRRLKKEKDVKVEEKRETFKKVEPKNMSFKTFARYMNQYEEVKQAYKVEKEKKFKKNNIKQQVKFKSKPVPVPNHIRQRPQYNPPNYPLSHLYNPDNRNNKPFFM
tara:strand:- start:60 stop:800 length:741 start_codon:yes stop_codon:yes gene_type:complete